MEARETREEARETRFEAVDMRDDGVRTFRDDARDDVVPSSSLAEKNSSLDDAGDEKTSPLDDDAGELSSPLLAPDPSSSIPPETTSI